MYQVKIINGGTETTIHSPFLSNEVPKLESGGVKKEINAIPSFTFSMMPNNPGYLKIYPYTTKVIVTKKQKTVFEGRVIIPNPQMDTDGILLKTVTCEGVKAYLHDSIQPYMAEKYWEGDEERNGLEEFIDHILSVHNNPGRRRKANLPWKYYGKTILKHQIMYQKERTMKIHMIVSILNW